MKKNYTILSLIELYLGKIWILIIAAVVCGAGAFAYTKYAMPLKYTSSVSLYAKNNNGAVAGSNINQADLNASQSLVETCIVILKEPPIMDQLSQKLLEKYSLEELGGYFAIAEVNGEKTVLASSVGGCISMSSSNGVLKISACTTNPKLSEDVCNAMAAVAPEVLMRVVKAGSVETIGAATTPIAPSSPSKSKNTLIGTMLGFMLVAAIILLRDFFDNTIIDTEDFSEHINSPIIGEIVAVNDDGYKMKKKNKKKQDAVEESRKRLLLNKDIPFYLKESFKTLRTNLVFALATKDSRIIGVSSPNPGDGKSNVSANLSITISQTDAKVLLIDCDMRKPTLHKLFLLKNKIGLSNVISNMCTFDAAVNKGAYSNLDILTSGPTPPNPAEMLSSEKMAELLANAAKKYDYVIVDTPPMNVVSDALNLSPLLAGLVVVARAGSTTYDDVARTMNSLQLVNAAPLGFVLNCKNMSDGRCGKYKYYRYKYFGYKKNYSYTYESDNEKLKKSKKKIHVS